MDQFRNQSSIVRPTHLLYASLVRAKELSVIQRKQFETTVQLLRNKPKLVGMERLALEAMVKKETVKLRRQTTGHDA